MSKLIFISGGQRSGKSRYAQELALKLSPNPIYLATARIWDHDFAQRIERHKKDRGANWRNLEIEKYISKANIEGETVLLDCIMLWLNNFFFDHKNEIEPTLEEAKNEWDAFIKKGNDIIVVSNEIGMGGHGENEIARKFIDLLGWMNQYIARIADEAYLMISGIAVKIK